jgi:hypothetical protein
VRMCRPRLALASRSRDARSSPLRAPSRAPAW